MENEALGHRIATLRKQAGLTQKELADRMNIAPTLISDYERGKLRVFAEILIKMAEALETTTDDILGFKTENNPKEVNLRVMRRLKDINELPEMKKKAILKTLDDLIKANS